jgi:hypothetical protein
MGSTHRHGRTRVSKATLWASAALVVIVMFVVIWVAARALMAREELLGAVPLASKVGSQALSGEGDVSESLSEIQERARTAAGLTSDPIWRATEFIPVLGNNLTAFREAASMVDQLATDALPPLGDLLGTLTLDTLSPSNGRFDLDAFVAAQPMIADALDALEEADVSAGEIDTTNTIPQIGIAVDQMVTLVGDGRAAVQSLDTAATLLPSMLGVDGPREYLLMSLNNAELRATGGIAGALAILSVDDGQIRLGASTNATALGEFDTPVLGLSKAEQTLYGDLLGTYMQDVNYTPDFARSGALAKEMWLERTGQEVDGVIALDPVALSYILRSTGPIDVGSELVLTDDNAVDVLLSGVYSSFSLPAEQDAFFASAMSSIFTALVGGAADSATLVDALGQSVDENRIHLWSADADEQSVIATTPMAGIVPTSNERTTGFGVYFNDSTGGKMDYYLSSSIGIASGVCRNDQRPNFEVRVNLESRAPADSAGTLPRYVTAGGDYGVTPGNISTSVYVYAPEGSVPYSVTIDDVEYAFVAANDGGHSVAGVTVELTPGQQSTVSMKFVGLAGAPAAVELQHTPMAAGVVTSLDNYLDCSEISPAPISGEEEQSGAFPSNSTPANASMTVEG